MEEIHQLPDPEPNRPGTPPLIPFPGSHPAARDPLSGLPPLLRAMRPLQWTKNLIVFTPLIFSLQVFELSTFAKALSAFLAFCLASSAIYLLNDVRDLDQDRLHPEKRFRPVATGEVAPRTALISAGLLASAGVLLAGLVRLEFGLVVVLYLLLMLAYNLGLKELVFLDVFAIAAGFLLRAGGGAVAIDVPISPWLYLCTLLLALLLGFGKRRHELQMMEQSAGSTRASLEQYSIALLDQVIAVVAGATILAYAIYTIDGPTTLDHYELAVTVPIVAYAIFRYLYLVYRQQQGGSPEVMLVTDRPLALSVLLWGVACIGILTLAG